MIMRNPGPLALSILTSAILLSLALFLRRSAPAISEPSPPVRAEIGRNQLVCCQDPGGCCAFVLDTATGELWDGFGSDFSTRRLKIDRGMSEKQVEDILGPPDKEGLAGVKRWTNAHWGTIVVEFDAGQKVKKTEFLTMTDDRLNQCAVGARR